MLCIKGGRHPVDNSSFDEKNVITFPIKHCLVSKQSIRRACRLNFEQPRKLLTKLFTVRRLS